MVLQNHVPPASDDVSPYLQQQQDQQRLLHLQQLLGGASFLPSRPSTLIGIPTTTTTTVSVSSGSSSMPSMATGFSQV